MAGGFELTFDTSSVQAAIDRFEANASETLAPTRKAARSAARVVRRLVSRDVQAKTGIVSAALRRRFRIYDAYDRDTGSWAVRAWFGTRPVSPFEAGAHETGNGWATKTESWPGATIIRLNGRSVLVQRYGAPVEHKGRRRRKFKAVRVPIHDHVRAALQRAMPKVQEHYAEVFADALRSQLAKGAM